MVGALKIINHQIILLLNEKIKMKQIKISYEQLRLLLQKK